MRVAGVDEVGRGPLAGAVVAAAVILDPQQPIAGLNDSKKLTPKRREQLAVEIRAKALAWSLGRAEVEEIDSINILQATFLAMQRALEGLSLPPDLVKIDGNRCPKLPYRMEAIVGGDATVAEISAASILAKVVRDAELVALDAVYPQYGFAPPPPSIKAMARRRIWRRCGSLGRRLSIGAVLRRSGVHWKTNSE